MVSPRGRDAARTRQMILASARTLFASSGFDRVTVRAIAAGAGVSPNLITRYFGGKHGLFTAATDVDLHLGDVLPGPRSGLGDRIAAHVFTQWEEHPGEDPLLTMLRAATSDATAAARLADFFRQQATIPLAEHLGTADAAERAAAVSVLITGTVVQRYLLAAGPLASADRTGAQAWLADVLQRLLTGPSLPTL